MTDIKPEASKQLPLPCAWDSGIFAVMGDAAGDSPIRPGTSGSIHIYPLRYQDLVLMLNSFQMDLLQNRPHGKNLPKTHRASIPMSVW